jgi:hypothetical protein
MTADGLPVRTLIVDTSALFPLLVYHYARRTGAERGRRQRLLMDARSKPPNLTVDQYDRWLRFFLSAGRRMATQHVVAELYGLRRRLRLTDQEQAEFWRCCAEFLISEAFQQRSCTLEDIWNTPGVRELSVRIGPVDGGLILLALGEGCTLKSGEGMLVSDDDALHREAQRLGINSELLAEILR